MISVIIPSYNNKDYLELCINSDLANNYGNLCQRVFSFIKKNCNNKIPKKEGLAESDIKLIKNIMK